MKWFRTNTAEKEEISPMQEDLTRGLLIFAHPTTVISVEEVLKDEGYEIRVVSPPTQYRTGCDLCVEFPLALDVVPITSKGMEPLQFVRKKDFGQYLMVRAANMKMTVEKKTKIIVNISGGGCPDVPHLATEMIGKRLRDAPNPGEVGFSLCAYSLNTAREEIIKMIGD
jgi:hypothetical protein